MCKHQYGFTGVSFTTSSGEIKEVHKCRLCGEHHHETANLEDLYLEMLGNELYNIDMV